MVSDPDYPDIVLSFDYRGYRLQVARSEFEGQTLYAVWAGHSWGDALAVPCAIGRREAVRRAKRWVDRRATAG